MATGKKRAFLDSYVSYGFTSIVDRGVTKPQCLLCYKVLGSESLKPSKLKQYLLSVHPNFADKDRAFFDRKQDQLKRQRLDSDGVIQQQNATAVEVSYRVSYEIARQKKPHRIGEELILPCAKTIVKLMLGEKYADKLSTISLSDNKVQHRTRVHSTSTLPLTFL